jgi:glycosyltransferase 2 family protein
LQEIWLDILNANYYWLIISLVFAIASHIFRALRWNLLINSLNYRTKLSTTFFAVMIGYMANTAVPRMGEFVRCGVLSKKEKIPFNALFGTVISERIFDLITLMVIIFLVIVFQATALGDFLNQLFGPFFDDLFSNLESIIIFAGGIILTLVVVVFLVIMLKERIKRIPFYHKIQEFLVGLLEGIKTIMKLKQKFLFLIYTFMIWLFYALMVYLPLLMLEETSHLTFINGLTILAIGSLGIVAPVPGGIGAYHFIVKTILYEIFKVGANASGSYAVITHTGQTLLNVAVGSLSYFYMGILAKREKPLNEKP